MNAYSHEPKPLPDGELLSPKESSPMALAGQSHPLLHFRALPACRHLGLEVLVYSKEGEGRERKQPLDWMGTKEPKTTSLASWTNPPPPEPASALRLCSALHSHPQGAITPLHAARRCEGSVLCRGYPAIWPTSTPLKVNSNDTLAQDINGLSLACKWHIISIYWLMSEWMIRWNPFMSWHLTQCLAYTK